ncbi:MAG: hypothetical protein LBP62_03600 [Clostridiales bacterium]|nr:hypothetical protein [Clostridiales bacterium]
MRGVNSEISKFIMESGDGYDKIFSAIKRFALGNRGSLDFLDADMREAKYVELFNVYFKTAQNIRIKDDAGTFRALVEAEFTAQKKRRGDYKEYRTVLAQTF